jgi:hypothetical protein
VLDCNTKKGKAYIQAQLDTCTIIKRKWGCEVINTPLDKEADIDCLLCRFGSLYAIAEIKSREMSRVDLINFKSYLITKEKLEKGRVLGLNLKVPFFLIVRLLKDNKIIWWKISDENGKFLLDFDSKVSYTQDNCNGGQAERLNAYIPVYSGQWIQ